MTDASALKITTGGDLAKYFGLSSRHMDAFAALGLQLFRQGKVSDAAIVFRGMIALDDQSFFGYAGLGALALIENPPDLPLALSNLQRAAALQPEDPDVHANLGEVLLRLARFPEAAQAFECSLRLDPQMKQSGSKRARAIIGAIDLIAEQIRSAPAA